MKRTFLFLVCSALLLAACAAPPTADSQPTLASIVKTDHGQYTNVTAAELQTMLKAKDFTFINVHVPFEGNIAQTDQSIPYDQIDQHLNQLPADKGAKIVLYCRSGNMSDTAARRLIELGYTNVYNLDGGFNAWKAAGLPLETNPSP